MRRRSLSVPNLLAIDREVNSFTNELSSTVEEDPLSPSTSDWMSVLGFDSEHSPVSETHCSRTFLQELEAQANPRGHPPGSNDILQVLDLGVAIPSHIGVGFQKDVSNLDLVSPDFSFDGHKNSSFRKGQILSPGSDFRAQIQTGLIQDMSDVSLEQLERDLCSPSLPSSPTTVDGDFNQSSKKKTSRSKAGGARRQLHVISEQKRRKNLKEGFDDLTLHVPTCRDKTSKVEVLHKAVEYIQYLKKHLDATSKENLELKQTLVFLRPGEPDCLSFRKEETNKEKKIRTTHILGRT